MENKYIVKGQHIEYLPEVEIFAISIEEAKGKYLDLWDEGMIEVYNSDINIEVN